MSTLASAFAPARTIDRPSLAARIAVFAYGVGTYAVFFVTFLFAAAWVGNIPLDRLGLAGLVPSGIDAPARIHWLAAVGIDLGLLLVFALQHSVMARPRFKRFLTRHIPQAAERSTYVLASSLALIALFIFWQPLGGLIWDLQAQPLRIAAWAIFTCGWLTVLVTTFLINHFDLFGLRQVWLFLLGRPYTQLSFVTPGPYRFIRHPLYVGWFLAFWGAPTMTATHLLFALVTTGYILFAIRLEERDLIAAHPEYADYRARTPMLIPGAR